MYLRRFVARLARLVLVLIGLVATFAVSAAGYDAQPAYDEYVMALATQDGPVFAGDFN